MRTTRIFTKIFLSNAVIGTFAVITISVIFYFLIRNSLIDRTVDQLASVNTLKAEQIDSYLNQHKKDLTFLFTHDFFLEHFDKVKSPLTVSNFPPEVGVEISSIKSIYNFTDISFVDPAMKLIVSTSNNPIDAKKVFSDSVDVEEFHWVDASQVLNSERTILLYVVPIIRFERHLGFVIVTENFDKVERLLLENAGMGATGESYIVGPDNNLRSASRFLPGQGPLTIKVNVASKVGPDHIKVDYRGQRVISFSRQLGNPELNWQLFTEIDVVEAMEPVDKFRDYLFVITLVGLALIVVVSLFISNEISKPVLYLRGVIQQLAKGVLPETPAVVKSDDEIGQITNAVNQLVEALRQTREFASLKESEVKLARERAAGLLEGQENERKRIIQELHDGVGQLLTAIRLRVDVVPLQSSQRKELVDLINDTIAEVKRISYNVMPGALVDFGLEAALKGLCDNTARYSRLKFDFQYIRESTHQLGFDVTVAVFRIVQEGINNILKHASAQNVELHILDKEDEIYVLLKDDGKGFEEKSLERVGMGLRSMRERAKLLGGNVDIHSEPNGGTAVEAHIPLNQEKNHE